MRKRKKTKTTYSIIGAAGYIAERHVDAIKATGGEVLAVCDVADSVGYIDKYFPECKFFYNVSECLESVPVDFVVVCTPNDLHYSHTVEALHRGFNVICEKPLATSSQQLASLEFNQGKNSINTILQLRYHDAVAEIRDQLREAADRGESSDVFIDYVAPRGDWYDKSWKGDPSRSGGILFNIGIHLFDMITHLLGEPIDAPIIHTSDRDAEGVLKFETADLSWRLSTNRGEPPRKKIRVNGREYSFSRGFENLHIKSHREILAGRGFGVTEVFPSTVLIEKIKRGIQCPTTKNTKTAAGITTATARRCD